MLSWERSLEIPVLRGTPNMCGFPFGVPLEK